MATLRRDRHLPKGGRIFRHGYPYRHVGRDHHLADRRGYAPEAPIVAEEVLGRRLEGDELVRRIGFVRSDSRPEMLVVVSPRGSWLLPDLARLETDSRAGACTARL